MRLALDTNRYSDLARNLPEVVARVEQADEVFLPFVVIAELRAGFAAGSRARKNEDALAKSSTSQTSRRFMQMSKPRRSMPISGITCGSGAHQFHQTICGSLRWRFSTG
jgi:hypothetical protein